MKKLKSIGILGGMGPEATAEFYLRMIRIFQRRYGFVNDYDYPQIYIYNLPLPEIVRDVKRKDIILALQRGVEKLESLGSDFLVCPCNSANTFFPFLGFKVPMINIFEETKKKADSEKIGIMGTRQTVSSGEFQKRLTCTMIPTDEELKKITAIIMNILSGEKLQEDKQSLKSIAKRFKEDGCDSLVLGCTELPLIVDEEDLGLKTYDTLQILAEAAVKKSIGDDENDTPA